MTSTGSQYGCFPRVPISFASFGVQADELAVIGEEELTLMVNLQGAPASCATAALSAYAVVERPINDISESVIAPHVYPTPALNNLAQHAGIQAIPKIF